MLFHSQIKHLFCYWRCTAERNYGEAKEVADEAS